MKVIVRTLHIGSATNWLVGTELIFISRGLFQFGFECSMTKPEKDKAATSTHRTPIAAKVSRHLENSTHTCDELVDYYSGLGVKMRDNSVCQEQIGMTSTPLSD